MAAASARDLLLPQPPGGLLRGGALALLAHVAMFVALTTVLQWRVTTPEAVVAELWSALPQQAAPPPPPPARPEPPAPAPPPPPLVAQPSLPDPQIAIAQAERDRLVQEKLEREQLERRRQERERVEREREARAKAERERAEQERLRKQREAEAERKALAEAKRREQLAREQKAAEERLAEQRQKNLERLMGQAGATAATDGAAAQSSGPSASYTARLVGAIKPNIVFTETIRGNPAAEVEVRAGASGSIIARRLVRSSGNKDWDDAVLRAIDRTGTLPRDVDGRVPPVLTMVFRPQE